MAADSRSDSSVGGWRRRAWLGLAWLGLARTIARDVFGFDQLIKILSYLTMIAGPLGGTILDAMGWRSILIAAGSFGALIGIVCWFMMFETPTRRPATGTGQGVFRGYGLLLRNLRFNAYVLQSGCASAVFCTMAAASSFVMIDYLGRPASEYGWYFTCFPAGFLTGSLISSRLAGRAKIETMVLAGSLVMVTGTFTQVGLLFNQLVTPLTIFLPGYFAILAQGIALPSAQSGAVNAAGPLAGTASGIGVFIRLIYASVSTQIYGHVADRAPYPMAVVVTIFSLLTRAIGAIPYLARKR